MNDEITINGKKYFSEEDIKKKVDLKDYFIMEQCNAMAIVPNKRNVEDEFFIEGIGNYKKYKGKFKFIEDSMDFNPEKVIIGETIYSMEFIDRARNTAKAYLGTKNLRIFLLWNDEEQNFIRDNPCLLVFENLVFILAPRIDEEDLE